jgi:hypothetical protein
MHLLDGNKGDRRNDGHLLTGNKEGPGKTQTPPLRAVGKYPPTEEALALLGAGDRNEAFRIYAT